MKATRVGLFLISIAPLVGQAQEKANESSADLSLRVSELSALVQKLQARVEELEGKTRVSSQPAAPDPGTAGAAAQLSATQGTSTPAIPRSGASLLGGTTVNFLFDGYYGFNFNNPIGRVNLLRAYDVSSNAFSLNQADVVIENAADPEHGKRFGLRLDLQYGQATATLQGNASNELRPDVYRAIFQAYGTYVFPAGKGLTVDFGKWASSLGLENNYTKDQINYSRSYWFNFLPFYHMGARVNYKLNDALALNYWVVNGTQQTEPFNGFKDQMFGLNIQPHKNVAWTVNYYLGQEHPDVQFLPNSTGSNLPTQQGIPFEPIPKRAEREVAYLRQLSDLAGVTQAHPGIGRRLRNSAASDVFCSVAHQRRGRLRSLSAHPEACDSGTDRIPIRPWRALHRRNASDQGKHLYL